MNLATKQTQLKHI